MVWRALSVLAVVPARGGSKGIPRKNLQLVHGLSLIGHVAKVVSTLPWIDATVLSTEDPEIAAEGQRHGLDTPFSRPRELAGDLARSVDAWRHAWLASEEYYGRRFDVSVLLQPTSPMRRGEDVEATMRALVDGGRSAAATVSRTPPDFTPEKTMIIDEERLRPYLPRDRAQATRQLIPAYYHANGICYASTRRAVVDDQVVLAPDCAAVVVDRPVVNIDEPLDLELAEWLFDRSQDRRER